MDISPFDRALPNISDYHGKQRLLHFPHCYVHMASNVGLRTSQSVDMRILLHVNMSIAMKNHGGQKKRGPQIVRDVGSLLTCR